MIAIAHGFDEPRGGKRAPEIPLEGFVRVDGETFGEVVNALARAERGEHIRFVVARHGYEIFLAPEPSAPTILFGPWDLLSMKDQPAGLAAVIGMYRVKVAIRDIGHGAQGGKK